MIQQLRFSGIMNKDDRDEFVNPGGHVDGLNVRFFGTQQGLSCQNIPGNLIVSNSNLPNTGTNKPNGSFYDSVRKRVYWFNYNSSGLSGLYYLNMNTRSVSKVFLCGTDSADDILKLNLDYPVHSMAIVYRTTSDGDLLYWTDGLNRPRYLNVDTVSTLAPFTEDMINAAKNAPVIPITAAYRDDTTVTVNNLRKQLFQFGLRWKYANLEYSTISPFSKLPLPVNFTNVDTQNDPTKNNNIRLTFKTGGSDFTEVELLGRVSTGTSFGNWFSIVNLNKNDYSFLPNTNYTFDFYNDGTYSTAGGVYVNNNPTDGELYFSYLPDLANTLESLNGNVIIYGGLTDGYDAIPRSGVDVTVIAGVGNPSIPTISWTQANTNQLIIYIGATISVGAVYHIQFLYDAPAPNTSKTVNYTTAFGDTQNSVANAIAALLTGGSLLATNIGAGVIELSNSSGGIYTVSMTISTSGSDVAAPSWDWACPERLGKIYFDDRGKTNGVISFVTNTADTTDFAVTTPAFSTTNNVPQVPYLAATLNDTPPLWATSYQWVRASLTPKLLYWVSNDYQTDSNYLYICIQNLIYTQTKISGYVPSYEFVKGDRIKICASYNSGTGFFSPYSVQLDMEILGVEIRTMTSPASNGSFIKVVKPSTFPATPYQANMLIKLYTPYVRQTDTQQIFFEWGERYGIYENQSLILGYTLAFGTFQVGETIIEAVTNATGMITYVSPTQIIVTDIVGSFQSGLTFTGMTSGAAGTITSVTTGSPVRYHRGQITDQTSAQPATFQWFDGDCYFRTRQFYLNVDDVSTLTIFTIDQNYSDYFVSEVNSNGRGWRIEPNAATIYKQTQSRWGQSYQQDTDINGLNIFYPNDFDTYDLSKGAIRRFKSRNRILRIFQEDGVGEVGVYNRYIKDSGGTTILETSDTIITTNNIQYYQGDVGLGTQPCGLVSHTTRDYFIYPVTGNIYRLSADGLTNLSELYKGQFYFKNILINYNKPFLQSDGSTAKLLGAYDYFDEQPIFIAQGGAYSGNTISSYAFSFNEMRNGFCSLYSFNNTEWIQAAEDKVITWLNGQIYINDNPTYCNFFGTQFDAYITVPISKEILEKKTWMALTELSDTVLECPLIYTNVNTYGSQRQESKLIPANFTTLEGQPSSSFYRDIHSPGGWINGGIMKGSIIVIKFLKQNASSVFSFNGLSVMYKDSPLTSK